MGTVMNLYMDHIQAYPSPMHVDALKNYVQSLSAEVVEHAINKALDANVLKFSYINAILQSYAQKKVTNIAQAKQVDQEYLDSKQRKGGYGGRSAQAETKQKNTEELLADMRKFLQE